MIVSMSYMRRIVRSSVFQRILMFCFIAFLMTSVAHDELPAAEDAANPVVSGNKIPDRAYNPSFPAKQGNIRTPKGRLYAYIILLYMDNPHFINQIQEGTVSPDEPLSDEQKVLLYRNYLTSIQGSSLHAAAARAFDIYIEFTRFSDKSLRSAERMLADRGTILKFSDQSRTQIEKGLQERPSLDYCIFGERLPIGIVHPFFEDYREPIYCIQPYVYYDEFSTSNSTFYHDMVFINPDEVDNDYLISRAVVRGRKINRSLLFVGAPVSDDIKACLKSAFTKKSGIKKEIWRIFAIHEMTHKILNIRYDNYEQVRGEEMSLSSTVYDNPRLGLAIMYSYLEYQAMNPHRIGALNYLSYMAKELGNPAIIENRALIRTYSDEALKEATRKHFISQMQSLQKKPEESGD